MAADVERSLRIADVARAHQAENRRFFSLEVRRGARAPARAETLLPNAAPRVRPTQRPTLPRRAPRPRAAPPSPVLPAADRGGRAQPAGADHAHGAAAARLRRHHLDGGRQDGLALDPARALLPAARPQRADAPLGGGHGRGGRARGAGRGARGRHRQHPRAARRRARLGGAARREWRRAGQRRAPAAARDALPARGRPRALHPRALRRRLLHRRGGLPRGPRRQPRLRGRPRLAGRKSDGGRRVHPHAAVLQRREVREVPHGLQARRCGKRAR